VPVSCLSFLAKKGLLKGVTKKGYKNPTHWILEASFYKPDHPDHIRKAQPCSSAVVVEEIGLSSILKILKSCT